VRHMVVATPLSILAVSTGREGQTVTSAEQHAVFDIIEIR